jgi:methyltransferase (TIGR00027 family)
VTTTAAADSTAVRVALWRARHTEVDAAPPVLDDQVGLRLADPDAGWRDRPDMDPVRTSRPRASALARARLVEDLVVEQVDAGVDQFVVLGAGLDTFVQRRPEFAGRLRVFEIDQPGTQRWKRRRLDECGYGVAEWLRLVPVDFEAGGSWWNRLTDSGFHPGRPTVLACNGVAMYLTRDAVLDTLRQAARAAAGSTLVLTFMLPIELAEPGERLGREAMERSAAAAGTPFVSSFTAADIQGLARCAGFRQVEHVDAAELARRYFADRTDGLRPSSMEEVLVARV